MRLAIVARPAEIAFLARRRGKMSLQSVGPLSPDVPADSNSDDTAGKRGQANVQPQLGQGFASRRSP
jgi:hypothetical protein